MEHLEANNKISGLNMKHRTNKMGLNMKHQVSFGKFVMIVLGCYFAFEIFIANKRLQSSKIGTLFGKVKEQTVQGHYRSHNQLIG